MRASKRGNYAAARIYGLANRPFYENNKISPIIIQAIRVSIRSIDRPRRSISRSEDIPRCERSTTGPFYRTGPSTKIPSWYRLEAHLDARSLVVIDAGECRGLSVIILFKYLNSRCPRREDARFNRPELFRLSGRL